MPTFLSCSTISEGCITKKVAIYEGQVQSNKVFKAYIP
jgi:hypothetical protein